MPSELEKLEGTEAESSGPKNPLDTLPAERYGITISLPEPFLQKHLEKFQQQLFEQTRGKEVPMSVIRGASVKAAVAAGWIKGLDAIDVGNTAAGKIVWVYSVLAYHLEKSQEIPPN